MLEITIIDYFKIYFATGLLQFNYNQFTIKLHAYADSSGFNVGRALARHLTA